MWNVDRVLALVEYVIHKLESDDNPLVLHDVYIKKR